MRSLNLITLVVALTSTVRTQDVQKDFTGIGNIFVLNSSDWRTAHPSDKVGCLNGRGFFINPKSEKECGVFSRLATYPYTLSSQDGNCTFSDETRERNTDSWYGKSDTAWSCLKPFEAVIYDELYTIVRHPPYTY